MPNLIRLPGLASSIAEINPDIIQLHFIYQDFLSLSQLRETRQPLIITLHDTLSFNPVTTYPGSDLRYRGGLTESNSSVYERWLFNRKRRLVNEKRPIFIGPSKWICRIARKSIIAGESPIYPVQNIVDTSFKFNRSDAHLKFTMLFGASGGRKSPLKGWKDFTESLRLLPDEIKRNSEVVIFGESGVPFEINGVKSRFAGTIGTAENMCRLHNSSSVFILPSKEDNAPQTKFEALLSGSPVISFNRTGCSEFITHKENGWIAEDGDIRSFAEGISYFYRLWTENGLLKRKESIAKSAAETFSNDRTVERILDVYAMAASGTRTL